MLQTTPDPALGSTIPYVLGTAVAPAGATVSPIFAYRNENPDPNSTVAAPGRTLQVAFGVSGVQSAQSSNFMVSTGSFDDVNGGIYDAGFAHLARQGGAFTLSRARGSVASLPGTVQVDIEKVPTSFQVDQNFVNRSTFAIEPNTAFTAQGVNTAGTPRPTTNYTFQQPVTRAADIAGLGVNRPDTTLTGFAGGMVRTVNLSTNSNIEQAQPLLGSAQLRLDPSDSRVQLNMAVATQRPPSVTPPTGALTTASFQLGNATLGQRSRGTYVDYDTFGAREAAVNVTATTQAPVSTVNGAALSAETGLMASSRTTNVQASFPGVTFCDCQYLRWGFWSDETQRSGFSDRVHLGTWVAGQPATSTQIPTTGTATYAGHVTASFNSNGNEYVAAGNMTNVINFGAQNGTMTVTNLDGRSYSGTVLFNPPTVGPPGFSGQLSTPLSTFAITTMQVQGGFFQSPTDPVKEIGGSVLIRGPTGSNYAGSGIFAGAR